MTQEVILRLTSEEVLSIVKQHFSLEGFSVNYHGVYSSTGIELTGEDIPRDFTTMKRQTYNFLKRKGVDFCWGDGYDSPVMTMNPSLTIDLLEEFKFGENTEENEKASS